MKVTMVPKDAVSTLWREIEPFLVKALDKHPNRYSAIDVYADIAIGDQSLWVAYDENMTVKAFWTVRVQDFPLATILHIEWVGGVESEEWVDVGLETLERYAKEIGCIGMTGLGREGWGRKFKPDGWRPVAKLYEKMFKEG